MHAWHPMLVHLPLGFLLGGTVVDLVGWLGRRPSMRRAGSVLLAAGLILAVPAVATGFLAYSRVEHSDAGHTVMNLHRNLMLAGVGLFAAAAVWRRRAGERLLGASLHGVLYGLLLILAASTLVVGADRGAQLVFGHATGIPSERMEAILNDRLGRHGHGAGRVPQEDTNATASDSAHRSGVVSQEPELHEAAPHDHQDVYRRSTPK